MFLYSNSIDPTKISFTDEPKSETKQTTSTDFNSTSDTNKEEPISLSEEEEEENEQEFIDLAPDSYFTENKQLSLAIQEKKEKAA